MSVFGKNVHIGKSADGKINLLRHNQQPFTLQQANLPINSATGLAKSYLHKVRPDYEFDADLLTTLNEAVNANLTNEHSRLRFVEKKIVKNTQVVSYVQTHFGLPVWQAGFNVRLQRNPMQVTSSQSTVHRSINISMPKVAIKDAALKKKASKDFSVVLTEGTRLAEKNIKEQLAKLAKRRKGKLTKITSIKPMIYQYDQAQRTDQELQPTTHEVGDSQLNLNLPAVPKSIKQGDHYIVLEVLFTLELPGLGEIHWRAFFELESGAILYLRAFVQGVNGLVFDADPVRLSGDATLTPCSPATDLDPLRSDVTLLGLTAPAGTDPQALTGEYVEISETNAPTIDSPTETVGTDFDYSATSDDFAAVNAYHHMDSMYRLVDDFGLTNYFDGTTFPVPVDHRGENSEPNAHHHGNATGTGTAKYRFGLLNRNCPVGYSTDKAPVIHEFGHGCLQDNIGSGTFSWAHGIGDSMAVILSDPGSQAPDRFKRSPFMNAGSGLRRHDRDVASGWAWGGSQEDNSYNSTQILSSSLFRAYQSTGGDDAHGNAATQLARREFAARYLTYLILGSVGTMTSAAPPSGADDLATALIDFDQANADFEGHPGGAFHKVIRWAFEKQGLYQAPGAPTPVTTEGQPPAVDVYIDDGRNGEYEWRQNFWNTTDIWSSRTADSTIGHETPLLAATNYLYVRVKNRGTDTATNVVVKAYHCRPSTGLVWPDDWQTMVTSELPAPDIASGGDTIVGPFEWIPEIEGHECLLASVSADGDASNADTVNGPIPHWRLVPFDNNLGQRNVSPEPGADSDALVSALTKRVFWINNPYDRTVNVEVEALLPNLLRKKNWKIKFHNPGANQFKLGPQGERKIEFSLIPGATLNPSELNQAGEALDIEAMIDNMLVGGMTYHIDPKLKEKLDERGSKGEGADRCCHDASAKLLDCMGLPHKGVKGAKLRKVTIDITFRDDDDCCC